MLQSTEAFDRAIERIIAEGDRPDPVRQRMAVDTRLAFLRAELDRNDLKLTGMGAMNAGRAVFSDLGTPRYQRHCRIVKLMQVRRWQVAVANNRNERLEYLKHAASCKLVEMRLQSALLTSLFDKVRESAE